MTLIITAIADDAVVQVSDRRLTRADGSICSDNACKAICMTCLDAHVSLAYTGLARIGPISTDHWLVEMLIEIRASSKRFPEVVDSLAAAATERFRHLRELGDWRRLSLVFGGFGPSGAMAALVSNQEDSSGRELSTVSDMFNTGFWLRNDRRMYKLDLMLSGATAAVGPELIESIKRIRKRFLHQSPEDRIRVLLQILRRAAKHPKYGGLIGEDCMGTIVWLDGGFRTTYHPTEDTALSYMPHFVGVGLSARDIWISTNETARPPEAPPHNKP
jgi:hypothetical protein